jgi:hypothetical protein
MTDPKPGSGRTQLLLIAAVFFLPLLLAAWLYYGGKAAQPEGRANHGALLEPFINLRDPLPVSPLYEHTGERWMLIYEHGAACDAACRDGLYTIRQIRLMLGKEMDRVGRIFLHGESPPDTVFLAAEHQGLISLQDQRLSEQLKQKKPEALTAGGYFLIDPLANLVMYFPPDIDPGDMVDDIKRLLKLSRIG